MIIEANKMHKLATLGDSRDIEQAIINAAYHGDYEINWDEKLSKTIIYDLISSGYEIHTYQRTDNGKYGSIISWKNAEN